MHFFTERQRKLMGLKKEAEPHVPHPDAGPACCDKATLERCTCEAAKWRCPAHGTRGQPCNANLSHD